MSHDDSAPDLQPATRIPGTELLTPKVVAQQLGLQEITLAKWRMKGNGPPFIRLGSRVMYPAAEYQAWLAAQPRFRSTTEADAAAEQRRSA